MRKTLLFILMAFCAIASSFAQTPKDVLAFQFKTSIASSAMLYVEVNSPQEEFYVDWGDGYKKKYAAGNYAYPNPVYSTNHKEEVKIYGTGINAIKFDKAKLTELDILDGTALVSLDCSAGALKKLDLSEATKLMSLNASHNEIAEINLSKSRKLTSLTLSNNKLTNLNLKGLSKIGVLECQFNELTTLDLTDLAELKDLRAHDNKLTSLILLDNSSKMYACHIQHNQIPVSVINTIIAKLPNVTDVYMLDFEKSWKKKFKVEGNPSIETANLNEAIGKSWILDVEPSNVKARFVMKVDGEAGAALSLKVAGVEDKLSVIVGDGEAKEYTVSKDITNLTPISVKTTAKDQFVVIEGDLLAINCKGNKLSTIDCASSGNLVLLDCSENQLGQLDLSGLKSAKYIYVLNNKITNLIVGELPLLEELNASFNGLNSINLTKLPALKALSVDNNSIANLTVEQNTKLEKLYCKKNKIQTLNVTMLPKLEELSAAHNRLGSIDLSKNIELEEINLKDNSLDKIDFTNNINLSEINVSENKLSSLNLTKCTKLKELYCNTNALTALDLSANKKLEVLSCGDNKLKTLNVEGFQELSSLAAMFNELTSVNVKNCPELEGISLNHNKLNSLDFTGCKDIRLVDIAINKFTVDNALKMIASLPEASVDNKGYVIYWDKETFPDDEEGNIYDIALSNKADLKNWVISNGEKTPLGIDELTINGDSKTFLTIASDKVLINGEYTDAQIFSTSGHSIARLYGEKEFNVAQLAEGVYIIKVNANGKKAVAKFVVKR